MALPSVTRAEVAALACAGAALALAWWGVGRARRASDPRLAVVQAIRREATARDLVVFTEEAPELVTAAAPVAALWGAIPLNDLGGVRRLYVLAPDARALAPYLARFGPPDRALGPHARAWALAGRARVRFDLASELVNRVTARRVGGADDGPCPRQEAALACHGPPWNHVRVENHRFDGAELSCVFAHPQADGRLVMEVPDLAPARALVGVVGIDDAGWFPEGAPVTLRVAFKPTGAAAITREVVAPNRKGLTPWRLELPGVAGNLELVVTAPNAGARQFCFTLFATE